MDNMNIDKNTMENIKNMVDNGNISDAISSISPEMIQNISKMLSNQNSNNNNTDKAYGNNATCQINSNNNSSNSESYNINNRNNMNNSGSNNFDINGIDMNTIMKMSSVIKKMNNSKDDPRANLLNSLKPYLREGKKEKLDNYMNLLNITKIAEIMKENNNENNKGG